MAEPGRAPIAGAAAVPISIDAQGNVTPANTVIADNGSIQVTAAVACTMTNVVPAMNSPFNLGPIPAGTGSSIPAAANDVTMNYYIHINGTDYGPYSITVGTPGTAPLALEVVGPSVSNLSQNPQNATVPAGGSVQYVGAPVACKAVFSNALAFGVGSQSIPITGATALVAQSGQNNLTVDVGFGPPGPGPVESRGGVGSGKNTIKIGH
jgi:hypothetical protein